MYTPGETERERQKQVKSLLGMVVACSSQVICVPLTPRHRIADSFACLGDCERSGYRRATSCEAVCDIEAAAPGRPLGLMVFSHLMSRQVQL